MPRTVLAKAVQEVSEDTEDTQTSEITFSLADLPQIAEWKDGETYTVTLQVKQLSSDKDSGTFEIADVSAGDNVEKTDGEFVKIDGLTPSPS